MNEDDSVFLMRQFQEGDDYAAEKLFAKYFDQLDRYAGRRMSDQLQQRIGSDDIAQSVYRSFFCKVRQGIFNVDQAGEVWKILAMLANRKVLQNVEWNRAGKRNPDREVAMEPAQQQNLNQGEDSGYNRVEVEDAIEFVLSSICGPWKKVFETADKVEKPSEIARQLDLSESDVRRVLVLRMKCATGLDNDQIRQQLDCSESTVRRLWRELKERAEELTKCDW